MVKIRMSRKGTKKRPFYHIVAADQRCARDGRYIERLGFFNPIAAGGEVPMKLDVVRLKYWRDNGAQVSESVEKLLQKYEAPAIAA